MPLGFPACSSAIAMYQTFGGLSETRTQMFFVSDDENDSVEDGNRWSLIFWNQ
jgi:hypothetical protein